MFVFRRLLLLEHEPRERTMTQQPQTSVITASHLLVPLFQRSADVCLPKISRRLVQVAAAGHMGITYAL